MVTLKGRQCPKRVKKELEGHAERSIVPIEDEKVNGKRLS
jgi:hypothetical protein